MTLTKRILPSGIAKGFTLIELLVVVAIIGILASIIVASLSNSKLRSRDAKRVSDIRQIQLALEQYFNENLHYPCDIYTSYVSPAVCLPVFTGVYMSKVPTDPLNDSKYFYSTLWYGNPPGSAGVNYYHLGAKFEETSNSSLTQDVDLLYNGGSTYGVSTNNASNGWNPMFDGNASGCVGNSAAASDNCYDVVPQ